MKSTAQVRINLINQAQSLVPPGTGVMYMVGETSEGPINSPDKLIRNWTQFVDEFGGLQEGNLFPLMCFHALREGATLRIARVTDHKTPFTLLPIEGVNLSGGTVEDVAFMDIISGGTPLFTLMAKAEGVEGNDIVVTLTPSEDGLTFDLILEDGIDTESYLDLVTPIRGTEAPDFLSALDDSSLVDYVYEDISTVPSTTLVDYSDAFDSFDDYDDGWAIAAPAKDELSLVGLYATGNSYASKRKDIVYLQNIPNSLATESAITTHLKTFNTSKWAGFIGGGLKIVDGSETVNVPALGAVMGLIASVHSSLAPWRNPTNYAAGRISQGVGVVNNFGSPARLAFLNGIAQEGGNMVVRKGNTVMLWDFYSMDEANSPDKFLSVVFLQVYMRRALTPVLESFLGLPNTFETWSRIYYTVKPFLDSLVDNQALVDYRWDGDQFAGSMQALQINTPTEVGQGKYKVQLQMKVVVPMVDITVNIVMTENSVDFS